MTKITYQDKDKNSNVESQKQFRDIDANEIKNVVNEHDDSIESLKTDVGFTAPDKVKYSGPSNTILETNLTSFARSILASVDNAAIKAILDYISFSEGTLEDKEIDWQGSSSFNFDTFYFYLATGIFEVSAYDGNSGENFKILGNNTVAKFLTRHSSFQFRNETDSAYKQVSVGTPSLADHATTKAWVEALTGLLTALDTTDKASLVNAINEVLAIANAAGGGGGSAYPPLAYDASTNVVPSTGNGTAGAILANDRWLVTVSGDIPNLFPYSDVEPGDIIVALINNATNPATDFCVLDGNKVKATTSMMADFINDTAYVTPSLFRTGFRNLISDSLLSILQGTEESFTTALKNAIDERPISSVLDLNSSQTIDFSSSKVVKVNIALTANRIIDTITNASSKFNRVVIDVADPNGFGVSFDAALNVEELGTAPTSDQYTIDLEYLGGTSYRAIYPESDIIASQVKINATGFTGGNLETTDDDVQKIAEKLNSFDPSQKDENTQQLFPADSGAVNIDFSKGTNVVLNLYNFTQNPVISISNAPIGDTGRLIIKPYTSEPTWAANIAAEVFPSTITSGNVVIYKVLTITDGGSKYHTLINEAQNIAISEAAYLVEETIKINLGNDSTTSPANWNTAGSAHADGVGHTITDLIRFSDGAATSVSVTSDTLVGKGNAGYDSGISDGSDNDGRITKSFHSFGNSTNWASETFNDLDPTKPYQVKYLYSSSSVSTGDFRVTGLDADGNAVTVQELDAAMQNNSTYTEVNNVYPTSGGNITVGFRDGGNLCAIIIERSNKPFTP